MTPVLIKSVVPAQQRCLEGFDTRVRRPTLTLTGLDSNDRFEFRIKVSVEYGWLELMELFPDGRRGLGMKKKRRRYYGVGCVVICGAAETKRGYR